MLSITQKTTYSDLSKRHYCGGDQTGSNNQVVIKRVLLLPAKPLKVIKQKDTKANGKLPWKPPLSYPWKRVLIGRIQTLKYDTSILQEV